MGNGIVGVEGMRRQFLARTEGRGADGETPRLM